MVNTLGFPVIRDFIYSEDVARGMIHLVENKVNDVVNLGSGEGFTIKEIVDTIAEYYDKKVEWMGDEKNKGDNISDILISVLKKSSICLKEFDVICIAHKIFSKAEGCIIKLTEI